ncbi:MAG TPA: cyclic nucleotide-binding domain-containing protein [Terriglobales bacterium]|jgi:CRP-like cAMP-binding protein
MSTGAGLDQVLTIVQTARNRLEYLTPNDWSLLLDKSRRQKFKKGDILIQQGKQSRTVYLLVSGRVKVGVSKMKIAEVGPGEICGEMAFMENAVASATVTAGEDVEATAIEWSSLNELFELFPHMGSRFYRSIAVSLSRRLREQIDPGGMAQ